MKMSDHECNIRRLLHAKGLKRSKDRHMMIVWFQESRTWTIPQFIEILPETDRSTIFRNIKALLKADIIREAPIRDTETHYELALNDDHHAYLKCEKCGVINFVPCPLKQKTKHSLQLFGLCSNCKKL